MTQEIPPPMQLMQMLFGLTTSRAIGVAAELCVADRLKDEPKRAQELAEQADVHAQSLYRILRACASIGVFSEDNKKNALALHLWQNRCSAMLLEVCVLLLK